MVRALVLMRIVPVLLASFSIGAAVTARADVPKLGATLRNAKTMHAEVLASRVHLPSSPLRLGVDRPEVAVAVRFASSPTLEALALLEARTGIRWHRYEGRLLAKGTVAGGSIPWNRIDDLGAEPSIIRIECARSVATRSPLYLSAEEIEATLTWFLPTPDGVPLTGAGILVADIDDGVDPFHPLLYRADGGLYEWIDVDGNGTFTPDVDAVDIDSDGMADPDEVATILQNAYIELWGDLTIDGAFLPEEDYLYLDENGNGVRDHGAAYGPDSPGLGEPIFIGDDLNRNQLLEVGEALLRLGTPKLAAVVDSNGVVRRRDMDLHLYAEGGRHGTSVLGILLGGWPGRSRLTGIAPSADAIVLSMSNLNISSFDMFEGPDLSFVIPVAESEGASIILHEYGWYIFDFLDGSGLGDVIMTESVGRGVLHVTPSGNLTGGGKHAEFNSIGGTFNGRFEVPSDSPPFLTALTFLWSYMPGNRPSFNLVRPGGSVIVLGDGSGSGMVQQGGIDVFYQADNSSRGTGRFDIIINWVEVGEWEVAVTSNGALGTVYANVMDDVSSWSGGVMWLDNVSATSTATFPSTTDYGFTVASYILKNLIYPEDELGGISFFSGRGPAVDGRDIMNIAAPGNFDIDTAAAEGFSPYAFDPIPHGATTWFGGTSAAGPHVAGAAAVLRQAFPLLDPFSVMDAFHASAYTDAHTGPVPNETWGYGKVRLRSALAAVDPGAPPALDAVAFANPVVPEAWSVAVAPLTVLGGDAEVWNAGEPIELESFGGYMMTPFFIPAAVTAEVRAESLSGVPGGTTVDLQ